MTSLNDLRNLKPKKNFFVALDSDGTIFDSMNQKHKNCFVKPLIDIFNLENIKDDVENNWIKINLFSEKRGINRFEALILTFELLEKKTNFSLDYSAFADIKILKKWSTQNKLITNKLIKDFLKNYNTNYKGLKCALEWSLTVNKIIKKLSNKIKPMSGALKALNLLKEKADIVVVSNTPRKTLLREWKHNNINSKVLLIGGQETGTKSQMIDAATKNKYQKNKILVIGDSFTDLDASINNNVLFYPIIPSKEKESWNFFLNVGIKNFFNLDFKKNIQKTKINEFKAIFSSKLFI